MTIDSDSTPYLDSFGKFVEHETHSVLQPKGNKSEGKFITAKESFENCVKKQLIVNCTITKHRNGSILYNQNHALFKRSVFNSKPVAERWKVVKINNLNQDRLRHNNILENCRINFRCKNCFLKHHTGLHVYSSNRTLERGNKVIPE